MAKYPTYYGNTCVPASCEYGRTITGSCEQKLSPSDTSPRYTSFVCSSYSVTRDAKTYLDVYPNKYDLAVCPPPSLFKASEGTGYWPPS